MQRLLLLFFPLALQATMCSACKEQGEKTQHTFLLSPVHCGNTWMRYCIETLTHHPTLQATEQHPGNLPIGLQLPGLKTDMAKTPVWKAHNRDYIAQSCESFDPKKDRLIFLIRDPKEYLVRTALGNKKLADASSPLSRLLLRAHSRNPNWHYIKLIQLFDEWEGDKILFYYEDLLIQTERELSRLCHFLKSETLEVEKFVREIPLHRKGCFNFYAKFFQTPYTLSRSPNIKRSLRHYQDQIGSSGFWEEILQNLNHNHPALFEKYLRRFSKSGYRSGYASEVCAPKSQRVRTKKG